MGTTAEKLTYLNTTKGKIKDSINLTGSGITNEPFRQYSTKLKDAYVDIINNGTDTLYNNFPKVSGSGTDLSLTPTYEAPMQTTLNGNTSQVQLSGKNLLDDSLWQQNKIVNNTTGEITSSQNNAASEQWIAVQPSTTYTFSASEVCRSLRLGTYQSDKTYIARINSNTNVNSFTFTTGANVYFIRWNINYNDTTITQEVIDSLKLQINSGNERGTYENYCGGTPSPNPSYPQDINVVSGDNTIYVRNKNLKSEGTIYNFYFNSTTFSSGNRTLCIPIEANTTYYIKKPIVSNRFRVCLSNAVPSTSTSVNEYQDVSSLTETSITNTNYAYLNIFYYQTGETYTEQELYDCLNIYTQETTYQLNLPVNNLFSKQAIIDNEAYLNESNVSNLTANDSGLSWTSTGADSYISLPATITGGYDLYIQVSENTTYTLSFTSNYTLKNYVHYIKSDYTFIERNVSLGSDDVVSFTTPTNCKYVFIRLGCSNQSGNTINITNIQLEKGSKANSYTPYGTTPIEMCNIGTYEDSFLRNTGKNLFDYNTFQTFTTTIQYVSLTLTPNTQYTMSSNIPVISGVGATLFFMKDGETASTGTNDVRPELSRTLTTDSTGIVKIGYRTGTGVSSNPKTDYWYQIEKGETATSYEPYGNGEWYKKANVGKVVLDGSDTNNWNYSNGCLQSKNVYPLDVIYPNADRLGLSNYFICKYYATSITTRLLNGEFGWNSGQSLTLKLDNMNSTQDYMTWLSTHNTTIYYILANTTYTKITDTTLKGQLEDIYNAKSKNGTTNISQENNDLPFIITASALKKD